MKIILNQTQKVFLFANYLKLTENLFQPSPSITAGHFKNLIISGVKVSGL